MSEKTNSSALPLAKGDVLIETRPDGREQMSRNVPAPARTLQPGDVTQEGLVVLRVTPEVGGRLHVRFEDDDTLWRVHRDTILWLRVAA